MITSEILEIIKDVDSRGDRVGLLADQFRGGRDIADLFILLNSDNEEIIEIGAWIAGEISIAPTNAQLLVSKLYQLVNHKTPSIRFHALGALFPYLDMASPATKEILTKMSSDPNQGVRTIAQATLKRTSQDQVK